MCILWVFTTRNVRIVWFVPCRVSARVVFVIVIYRRRRRRHCPTSPIGNWRTMCKMVRSKGIFHPDTRREIFETIHNTGTHLHWLAAGLDVLSFSLLLLLFCQSFSSLIGKKKTKLSDGWVDGWELNGEESRQYEICMHWKTKAKRERETRPEIIMINIMNNGLSQNRI